MPPGHKLPLALILLSGGFGFLEPRTAAQEPAENSGVYADAVSPSHPSRNSYALGSCGGRGLVLCVDAQDQDKGRAHWAPAFASEKPSAERAPLTRFARLAGMFMGRVEAGQLGNVRIRLKLALE